MGNREMPSWWKQFGIAEEEKRIDRSPSARSWDHWNMLAINSGRSIRYIFRETIAAESTEKSNGTLWSPWPFIKMSVSVMRHGGRAGVRFGQVLLRSLSLTRQTPLSSVLLPKNPDPRWSSRRCYVTKLGAPIQSENFFLRQVKIEHDLSLYFFRLFEFVQVSFENFTKDFITDSSWTLRQFFRRGPYLH